MKSLWHKKIPLSMALALCGMAAVVGVCGCYALLHWDNGIAQEKLREIDMLAAQLYVGEMDKTQIADLTALGYVTGLGDRWTSYIPADEYEAYALQNEGQTCGIGVSIALTGDTIRVSDVYDDSPALQAGIVKGDFVTGAEGLTVEADGTDAVVSAIQGEEGTEVTVNIRKGADGREQTLTMTRAIVQQRMAWGEMLENQIGYIRINNFHAGSAEQFQAALDTLLADGAESLILDVRHNGGGRVKEMSAALDPLLPEGTIMTLRTKAGKETVYTSDEANVGLPMVALIDDRSISAAEFFAAALQEYGCATLVGTHTTGKGRAQQTFVLSDGSALNLSVEQYYTPQGKSLADIGIAPDVDSFLSDEQQANFFFLTFDEDTQLQTAIAVLSAPEGED